MLNTHTIRLLLVTLLTVGPKALSLRAAEIKAASLVARLAKGDDVPSGFLGGLNPLIIQAVKAYKHRQNISMDSTGTVQFGSLNISPFDGDLSAADGKRPWQVADLTYGDEAHFVGSAFLQVSADGAANVEFDAMIDGQWRSFSGSVSVVDDESQAIFISGAITTANNEELVASMLRPNGSLIPKTHQRDAQAQGASSDLWTSTSSTANAPFCVEPCNNPPGAVGSVLPTVAVIIVLAVIVAVVCIAASIFGWFTCEANPPINKWKHQAREGGNPCYA